MGRPSRGRCPGSRVTRRAVGTRRGRGEYLELQAGEAHLAGSVLYFQHQPTAQAQPSKRRGDVKSTGLSDLMVHAR